MIKAEGKGEYLWLNEQVLKGKGVEDGKESPRTEKKGPNLKIKIEEENGIRLSNFIATSDMKDVGVAESASAQRVISDKKSSHSPLKINFSVGNPTVEKRLYEPVLRYNE